MNIHHPSFFLSLSLNEWSLIYSATKPTVPYKEENALQVQVKMGEVSYLLGCFKHCIITTFLC